MYHQPKVTVIIPAYNAEKYLVKAIDSVRKQTLAELEILIIDDGSTDKTPLILQQKKMEDNRIEVITHPKNLGLGEARNTGIQKASGTYLFFLDSDDYLHLNFLESLYEKAKKEQLDILQAQFLSHKNQQKEVYPKNLIPYLHPISGIDYYREGIFIEPKACGKLWQRDFLVKHQLQFAPGYYEDMVFTHQAFARAQKVNNHLLAGYHYVQRNDSITGQQITAKHVTDYQNMLQDLQALFLQENMINPKSSFPASFGLYLVNLCSMSAQINDTRKQKEVKDFVGNLIQKYGQFIRINKNLPLQKRFLIGSKPCLYAQLKTFKK